MTLSTIINIVLIAILVICAWIGYKKGIIMGIIGVLVIILSLYGAQVLANAFSSEVLPVMKPFVSGVMDTSLEEHAYKVLGYEADENGNYNVPLSLTDLMNENPESRVEICRWVYRDLGLYDTLANDLARKTVAYADQNSVDIPTAVTDTSCESASWYACFIIAFILIFSVLTVILNLTNLSFRFPYIGAIDHLAGLAIGVYTGLLFCSLLLWLVQFAGILLPEDTLHTSGIAEFIMDRNLLSTYITF